MGISLNIITALMCCYTLLDVGVAGNINRNTKCEGNSEQVDMSVQYVVDMCSVKVVSIWLVCGR